MGLVYFWNLFIRVSETDAIFIPVCHTVHFSQLNGRTYFDVTFFMFYTALGRFLAI